ncbi:MAG: hypothetical protein WAT93_03285, partial [Pontixanthobacter sp.]
MEELHKYWDVLPLLQSSRDRALASALGLEVDDPLDEAPLRSGAPVQGPEGAERICGGTPTGELRSDMQKTMQKHAAVLRDSALMKEGVKQLAATYKKMSDIKVSDRS